MEPTLLEQGFELMLVGMGTVFLFLTVLVFAMNLMSRLAARFETTVPVESPTPEEVAAITSAIALHRHKK